MLEAGRAERADLNVYIVYAWDQLGDETAVPASKNALNEGRINTGIMGLDSLNLFGTPFDRQD
jgi:hypothetical protein